MSTDGGARKGRLFGRPGPLTVPIAPFGRSGPATAAPAAPADAREAPAEDFEPTIRMPMRPGTAASAAAPSPVELPPTPAPPAAESPPGPAESPPPVADPPAAPPPRPRRPRPPLSAGHTLIPDGALGEALAAEGPSATDPADVVPDLAPAPLEAPRPPTPVMARDVPAPPGGEPTLESAPVPSEVDPEVDPEADTLREVRVGELQAAAAEEFEVPRPLEPWERPLARVARTYEPGRFAPPSARRAVPASSAPNAAAVPAVPRPPAVTSVSPSAPGEVSRPRSRPLRSPDAPAPVAPAPSAVARMPTAASAPVLPNEASATAPGKIILIGEHAVVYGHRAIAAAVDLGTTVSLYRRPGPSRVEDTPIQDPRLGTALASVIPAEGIGVTIRTTLPVGCGMGSSAALAVATIRALARLEGREASLRECVDQGFAMERVFHGNPSGLDHTVSASGGVLLYRRGEAAEELKVPRPIRLVIANSGTPGNTAEMVARVKERNPVDQLMRIGALVELVAARLSRGEPIGEFIREAHRCLRLMGVSTPALDDLCRAMEAAGAAGAKLAGAGGGGVVIALVDERSEEAVRRAATGLAAGGVWAATIG